MSKTKTIWDNEINQRIKQNPNEIVGATESVYMNYVLEYDSGKQEFSNLKSLINNLGIKTALFPTFEINNIIMTPGQTGPPE